MKSLWLEGWNVDVSPNAECVCWNLMAIYLFIILYNFGYKPDKDTTRQSQLKMSMNA